MGSGRCIFSFHAFAATALCSSRTSSHFCTFSKPGSQQAAHPVPPGSSAPAQPHCCCCCRRMTGAAPPGPAAGHCQLHRTALPLQQPQPPPRLQWAARARSTAAASCRCGAGPLLPPPDATGAQTGQRGGHQSGRSGPGSAGPAGNGCPPSKGAASVQMRRLQVQRPPAAPPRRESRIPDQGRGTGCRRRGSTRA